MPDAEQSLPVPSTTRVALVLGGGAARGLAHVGVLDVLEHEGIRPSSIIGSSLGGLIGALSAAGLPPRAIADEARRFGFPKWFILGRLVKWERIFPSIPDLLGALTFEGLNTKLGLVAVDFERGEQAVLHAGPLLPAVRATCSIPGILPPEKIDGRWLVDGGLLNVLPVDVAWTHEPDVVVAVNVGSPRARALPQLEWHATSALATLGTLLPNPATAKVSFEVMVRAAEILLAQQTTLASAMFAPDVLIEPDLGNIGLRDFHRVDQAIEAGRRATLAALPAIRRAMGMVASAPTRRSSTVTLHFDPVCQMIVSPERARATSTHQGEAYYFCSTSCHDAFEHQPERYARA